MNQKTHYTVFLYVFVPVVFFALLSRTALAHAATHCNCTPRTTARAQFQNSVLIRRSRSAVFPKKAFVLITPAFAKAIIGGRPTGVGYSIEFDMYSKLPDTIEAWQPTLLINKVKQAAAKEQDKPKLPVEPASAAQALPWTHTFPTDPLATSSSVEDDMWPEFWPSDTDNRYQLPIEIASQLPLPQPDKSCDFNGRRLLQDYCRRNDQWDHSNTKSTVSRHFHKIPKLAPMLSDQADNGHDYSYQAKWSEEDPQSYSGEYADESENIPVWKYHQSYRERREIFEQLEVVGKMCVSKWTKRDLDSV